MLEELLDRWSALAPGECQLEDCDGVNFAVITTPNSTDRFYIPGAEFGCIADAGVLMQSLMETFCARGLLYAIENSTRGMHYVSLISFGDGAVVSLGEDKALVMALLKAYLNLLENLSTEVRAA